MNILGISCFFHDSAACLVRDDVIIAAAQEERFTRVKHDSRFPFYAINYCLEEAQCEEQDVDYIVFYEKTSLALDRIATCLLKEDKTKALLKLKGLVPSWANLKLNLDNIVKNALKQFQGQILCTEHHQAHVASAFFPSPFHESCILTIDGVGEWVSATMALGKGSEVEVLKEMHFPHSLGLFYSAFTYYTGFKVNSGEYKFMGLAPYGIPVYYDLIRDHIIDIKPDGSLFLDMEYFDFIVGDKMISSKFAELFGHQSRKNEAPITKFEMDVAASAQKVTEEVVYKMAKHLKEETQMSNLCLAGGVALNCVANGMLSASNLFEKIWIQPASGDAGGALGSALATWHTYLKKPRKGGGKQDTMQGSFLGVGYSKNEILDFLEFFDFPYEEIHTNEIAERIAGIICEGNILGLFQGRMEFGPRALGHRSILGDPRQQDTQTCMNLKIKFRESFRPFAPVVMRERLSEWFETDKESPYMLQVASIHNSKRYSYQDTGDQDLMKRLNQPRSQIPAVTHVDFSARYQTVTHQNNPYLYAILKEFEKKTGVPILVNTSFNVRGEPIVCTPMDAYRCMMRTEIDCIVLENMLLWRKNQPEWNETGDWKNEFTLD